MQLEFELITDSIKSKQSLPKDIDYSPWRVKIYHKDWSLFEFARYCYIVHVYAILLVDFETKPKIFLERIGYEIVIHTCTLASVRLQRSANCSRTYTSG